MKTIALASTVSDGLVCKIMGELKVTTEYHEGESFEGELKTFETIKEANEYIEENKLFALYPIEVEL